MDQHGAAGYGGKQPLRFVEPTAPPDVDTRRQIDVAIVADLVGGDQHLLDAFGEKHLDDREHVELSERILTARHGHRAVVEQLVRDVGPVGDCGAHGQHPGVEQRAITDVLEQVRCVDERRHPEPLTAFAAHGTEPDDVAAAARVHQHHHRVAADTTTDDRAVGNLGRGVVRASGAEVGGAVDGQRDQLARHGRRGSEPVGEPLLESQSDSWCDQIRIEGARAGNQRRTVGRELANDDRTLGSRVEHVLDQPFEQRRLLLDDHDLCQPIGELADQRRVDRIRHGDLQQPDSCGAELVGAAQAEQRQRLHHLEVGVAGGDDADPIRAGAHRDGVDPVQTAVLRGDNAADLVDVTLHCHAVRREQRCRGFRRVRHPIDEELGHDDGHPVAAQVGSTGPVGDRFDDLDRRPQARRARHGHGVTAEVDGLLDVAGVEHRDVQIDQRRLARGRDGAALGLRVVTDDRYGATLGRRAGEHCVTDGIACAVDSRTLAVPHTQHTVVAERRQCRGHLRTHHRCGGKFLVEAGLEDHLQAVGRSQSRRCRQITIETCQRAARVARHVRSGVQPNTPVRAELIDR